MMTYLLEAVVEVAEAGVSTQWLEQQPLFQHVEHTATLQVL